MKGPQGEKRRGAAPLRRPWSGWLAWMFAACISVSEQKCLIFTRLLFLLSFSFSKNQMFALYYIAETDPSLITSCKIFGLLSSFLGPSELEMNMGGAQYSQQQAPPNQTAPWPESILPIDQASFASQSRWVLSPQEVQESCFPSSVRYFPHACAPNQSSPFNSCCLTKMKNSDFVQ